MKMNTRKRASKPDSPPSPSLPQELITEVLLRLPAKSIGRFRCVSKPWRSLLSHPNFIKSHLTLNSIHNPPKLIVISSMKHTLFTITFTLNNNNSSRNRGRRRKDVVSGELKNTQDRWYSVLCSCHGLVLLDNYDNCKFLINPTTQELLKVPDFSLALDPSANYSMHGFGYDSSSDDYKIVTLSYSKQPGVNDIFVDIYSLKMKTWRRIENFPYDRPTPHEMNPGVFLNGAIHWLTTDASIEGSPTIIAAFNLSNEKFMQVPASSCFDFDKCKFSKFKFYKLVVLGECLGMVCDTVYDSLKDYCRIYYHIDIWVMKEYGVQEFWTRFRLDIPLHTEYFNPICQLGDEEIVLLNDGEKLVLHNLMGEYSWNMVVPGMPGTYLDGIMNFSESLVSLTFYNWDAEA